ncbi:MAG: N-acetylmuramoyl-L-alanine amidase [Rickettsiales bacterium]
MAVPAVLSTEIEVQATGELIELTLSAPLTKEKLFTLKGPDRVVLDVSTLSAAKLVLPKTYKGNLIKAIRFGQFDAETSRIVIELTRGLRTASLHQFTDNDKHQYRLAIDLVPGANLSVNPNNYPVPQAKPGFTKEHNSKPLIVIDAGHGGKDPGATGAKGTHEKDITLRFAKALREGILRTGRYRVALTREGDYFVLLPDRVRLARNAGGDAFVSLHADSAPRSTARGLSVYTVSEKASDEESAALAEQENAVDELAGYKIEGQQADVADILIDLAQRDTKNKSSELADSIVGGFAKNNINMLSSAHRFAGFRVLKAPDIPSTLIELGFLSEPRDEAMLKTAEYQRKVISGIISGLDAYFRKHPAKK